MSINARYDNQSLMLCTNITIFDQQCIEQLQMIHHSEQHLVMGMTTRKFSVTTANNVNIISSHVKSLDICCKGAHALVNM